MKRLKKMYDNGKQSTPWNQKNLDYEIETMDGRSRTLTPTILLEIKRTSITRLKQGYSPHAYTLPAVTWNQKNLDYEIETCKARSRLWASRLEIKRTSITRLKQCYDPLYHRPNPSNLKSKEPRLRDWNSACRIEIKTLNFFKLEIKRTSITRLKQSSDAIGEALNVLEIKRTSITRLKLGSSTSSGSHSRWTTWNQKNLDYEIETNRLTSLRLVLVEAWNQKNLDYEIETNIREILHCHISSWNQKNLDYEIETCW